MSILNQSLTSKAFSSSERISHAFETLLNKQRISTQVITKFCISVNRCEYLSAFKALLDTESEIIAWNIFVDALKIEKSCSDGESEINERRKTVNKVVIAGASVGVVASALVITGLALAPVTAGVSLGLSLGGGILGVFTGGVTGATRVVEAVKQNSTMEKIDIETVVAKLAEREYSFLTALDRLLQKTITINQTTKENCPGKSLRGFLAVGSAFRSVHSVVSIGIAAARIGASTAGVAAGVLGPLSLVLDLAFLAEAAHNKRKGDKTNAGDMLSMFANIVKMKSRLLNGMLRGNTETTTRTLKWVSEVPKPQTF